MDDKERQKEVDEMARCKANALEICRRVYEGEIRFWEADRLDAENDFSEFAYRVFLGEVHGPPTDGERVKVFMGGEARDCKLLAYHPLSRFWDLPTIDVMDDGGCVFSGVDAARLVKR